MVKLLHKPVEERKKQANMARFINYVNRKYGPMIDSYTDKSATEEYSRR